MEKNKATNPDKIPIEFYQVCWEIVKADIMQLFADFHDEKVNTSRINYGVITLLPKITESTKIQQFRPISLLNCLYMLVTKTFTLRFEKAAERLIHTNRTAFIKRQEHYEWDYGIT